jgi:hypothetical protein
MYPARRHGSVGRAEGREAGQENRAEMRRGRTTFLLPTDGLRLAAKITQITQFLKTKPGLLAFSAKTHNSGPSANLVELNGVCRRRMVLLLNSSQTTANAAGKIPDELVDMFRRMDRMTNPSWGSLGS